MLSLMKNGIFNSLKLNSNTHTLSLSTKHFIRVIQRSSLLIKQNVNY